MKRAETLVKELLEVEAELRQRNPKEVCRAIEKIGRQGCHSTCLSCFYQGCRDMLMQVDGEDLIDTYEEEN